jgi:5'-nucleotidase
MLLLSAGDIAAAGPGIEPGQELADPAPSGESGLLARLLFTSNRRGEFEPCSCPDLPLGGIAQTVGTVDAIRQQEQPLFWLDSGDRLFRVDMALLSTEEAGRRLRAMVLIDAANLGGLDAMGLGRLDLGAGLGYLKKLAARATFPMLSANLVDPSGELLFQPSVMLKRGDLTVGVTSVLADDVLGDGFQARPARKALRSEVKKLRAQGAQLVVVLSNLGADGDRKLARGAGADVILGSHSRHLTPRGELVGKTLRGEAGSRGRYLGDLRWYRSGSGRGPHLVLTTLPVHTAGARNKHVDALAAAALRRLRDPVLGVPPIPFHLQDDPRRGARK